MDCYRIGPDWVTVHTRILVHRSEDVALLKTLRSAVFRQMLEPPAWDGTRTVLEGRPRVGAEHRLQSLGFVGQPRSTDHSLDA